VRITGRKKELMKTSGGKYIAPAKLEGRLKNHPLVQEAITVADTRNYVTALLAIDMDDLTTWAQNKGVAPDPQSEAVKKELQAHIDAVNETLARYETVKYFRVIPPMTVDGGLLTASLKVKRKPTYERYAGLIEEMYAGGSEGD
jgi:long-chain acyl-CoA synthetase